MDCNFRKVLNVPEFQIFHVSAYERVMHGSEHAHYDQIKMEETILNTLNRLWLWQGSGYVWSKFRKVLNMPPVLNARSPNMTRL